MTFDTTGIQTSAQDPHKLTPTVALLWTPSPRLTLYASYAQSLQPGGQAPVGTSNEGQVFAAVASVQYEAGVKAELGALLATAAVFRIEEGFDYQRDVSGALPLYVQDGIERHDGVEAQVSGHVREEVRLVGGVQYLDPTVQDSTLDLRVKRPPGVPDFQGKLLAEYSPRALPGAAVSLTASYIGDSKYDALNTRSLKGYGLLDAGARYRLTARGTPLTLRASVNNLLGERYYLPRATLIPGAPRAVSLSLSAEF